MTSLAPLAHAAAPPPFNGLFYATAATIIPVLFLAIAVQGSAYENLIKAMAVLFRHIEDSGPRYGKSVPWAAYFALFVVAAGILAYGIGSEIQALYALYQQQAESLTGQTVLIGVILLIIVTAAGPVLNFVRSLFRSITQAGQQRPGHTPPDAKALPETGKTDPA